jgi:hypothetical protein
MRRDEHHHHHHHYTFFLRVYAVHGRKKKLLQTAELKPGRHIKMATEIVTVGNTLDFSVVILDQNGVPLVTQPNLSGVTFTWTQTTPATDTLTANGATATDVAVAVGTDTISVSATGIPGAAGPISGSLPLQVNAAPQVPTSLQINAVLE